MAINVLTAVSVNSLVKAGKKGRTADGGGLYLNVRAEGRADWVFRYAVNGTSKEMGLGGTRDVTLAQARQKVAHLRVERARGLDPLLEKAEAKKRRERDEAEAREREKERSRTFRVVAEARMAAKAVEYTNAKHRGQWPTTMAKYVFPVFGDVPIDDVSRDHVLEVLEPIWQTKHETATRVRQRIEAVCDYAAARGWRTKGNPATLKTLKEVLPVSKAIKKVRHHPSLSWQRVPAFVSSLKSAEGIAPLALRFLILTTARSQEVRLATWSQVDLKERIWTVPAENMKAKREHRVPLSPEALAILTEVRKLRANDRTDALIFPGRSGGVMSDMTLAAVIKRLNKVVGARWVDENGAAVVPHGFRSSFMNWCADNRREQLFIFHAQLAHAIPDTMNDKSYRSSDNFRKREPIVEAWGRHCLSGGVVDIKSRRGVA